jgi:DNA mismatch repair ATPase MutS
VEARAESLLASLAALARGDLWLARARLAAQLDAARPSATDDAAELLSARHPLLGQGAVPIDLRLGERFGYRALVVTGPNTGGKTVSLKTLGLLALMHQAGLRVPAADGARMPVFRQVMADIGDEQSIAQSLSTFSSHLRNVVRFLEAAGPRTLVLLDEIGAGTDPTEGSALAMAVVTVLLERGALVAATTHYAELKAFAETEPGVTNAAVEFDVATLRPTYHLSIGLPGASQAFAIAERLGLDSAHSLAPQAIARRAQKRAGHASAARLGGNHEAEDDSQIIGVRLVVFAKHRELVPGTSIAPADHFVACIGEVSASLAPRDAVSDCSSVFSRAPLWPLGLFRIVQREIAIASGPARVVSEGAFVEEIEIVLQELRRELDTTQ